MPKCFNAFSLLLPNKYAYILDKGSKQLDMKLLLILPPFERLMGYKRFYTHPGLLSIAAVAESAFHHVLVYDADYDYSNTISYDELQLFDHYQDYVNELTTFSSKIWQEIREVIESFEPDFIGISVLSVTQESARKVAQIAKELNQNIEIIVGGVHPTLIPTDFLDYADYIVQGEGESVINEILDKKLPKGIICAKRIEKLDALPLPAIHLLHNLDKYEKRDLSLVISSRGCYYNCSFCNSSKIWNRVVKHKSVSHFIKEIEQIKNKYDVTNFYISDDSFCTDKKWLYNFCNEISKINVSWRCLARIDQVDKKELTIMKEAGCYNIYFGIESGSQAILNKVNKSIQLEDVYRADAILKEMDFDWSAYFMMGFPCETEEDIVKTQELIRYISAKRVTLSIFTPYPGCDLFTEGISNYKLYSHHSPYNNFTGVINNDRFQYLVREALILVSQKNRQINKGNL